MHDMIEVGRSPLYLHNNTKVCYGIYKFNLNLPYLVSDLPTHGHPEPIVGNRECIYLSLFSFYIYVPFKPPYISPKCCIIVICHSHFVLVDQHM